MKHQRKAYVYAAGSVLLWSTVASAFKMSLRYLDVFQLLAIASVTAASILLLIVLLTGRHRSLKKIAKEDYLRLAYLGILNPFCYYLILFKAYALLPAQMAQALNYTWGITLMLLSAPFLKHTITRRDYMATVICYGGVLVICFSGDRFPSGDLSGVGIVLALTSTLVWSVYWLVKTKDAVDPVSGLFLSFLFGLPFVLLICGVWSDFSTITLHGLLAGVYVGLFEMGVTYILWLSALRLSEAVARISTMIFLSPFLSLFFIHYVLGETIVSTTIIGLVLILSGLLVQHRYEEPQGTH